MNLCYKILWVDDRIDNFVDDLGFKVKIENYLKDMFFLPSIDTCETVEDARRLVTSNKYDLILSDYNINKDMGDDFIRYVRAQDVNTEILFYSALTTVPGLAVDRISFFSIPNDNGYFQLLDKIKKLIDLTIKKLQELITIRGLVMAETSLLDKLMEDIIIDYFVTKRNSDSDTLFNNILDSLEESHKKRLEKSKNCEDNCTLKLRKKDFKKIITSREFESSYKARTINKIIEKHKFDYKTDRNFFEDYTSKINSIRNQLAHSNSKIVNGVEVLITKDKDNNEIVFDETKFKEVRQNILKYTQILEGFKKSLS